MALVIGHSQAKYLSKCLDEECYSVFSYRGYRVRQFHQAREIVDVAPFFSVIVLVVGANDIGYLSPAQIVADIRSLCESLHDAAPSATVIVSEVLPRAQNRFDDCQHTVTFLDQWNWDAGLVNQLIRQLSDRVSWLHTIDQYEFHTLLGPTRHLLSRDGLHLSPEGLERLASSINAAVQEVPTPPHESELFTESVLSTETALSTECLLPIEPEMCTASSRPSHIESSESVLSTKCTYSVWRHVSKHRSSVRSNCDRVCARAVSGQVSSGQRMDSLVRDLPSAPTFSTGIPSRKHKLKKSPGSSKCSVILSVVPTNRNAANQRCRRDNTRVTLVETSSRYYLSSDGIPLVGGGGTDSVPIWSETDRVLTQHEAADILIQNIPDSTTYEPPYRPTAGRTYLFDDGGNPDSSEDWRADGYTWRNYGKKKYKINGQELERHFFKINNQGAISDKFQKHAFRFVGSDYNGRTLLVYFGDSTSYLGLPHKNRKKNNRPHKRTKPSVIKEIKTRCMTEKPAALSDRIVSEKAPDAKLKGISVPRNERQIKNFQAKVRHGGKLTHDSLYSLHLLVDQLDQYIIYTKTIPDLEVIVGNKEIFDEVNKLLQVKDIDVELYYDTTFNLGDFCVSTAAIQHPMFKERPLIPVAFMIHERKYQSCHENFINELKKKIPKLTDNNVNIVTDRERGIINAFSTQLPNSTVLVCWNHILNDVKFWVSKHGGSSDDKKVYESHVKGLLQSENHETFERDLQTKQQLWSQAFVDYFNENLKNDIEHHAARWILEEKDIYNPYAGITNNVSESLNAKLKRLIDYKERAIDEIVLFLYYSQGNYLSDLIRAFCGESEWTLKNNFKYAKLDPETISLPKNVCHPDKLIQMIKGELSNLNKPEQQKISEPAKKNHLFRSQHSLAERVIKDNDIVFVPQMGAFMVNGSRNEKYSVSVFPNEKCSCPATSRCYHIIAAMKSIGMTIPEEKKVYNLTQLRRNCRPKAMKKCGTKKGRRGDNDTTINAAPDSTLINDFGNSICMTPKSDCKDTSENIIKRNIFTSSTPKSILKNTATPKSGNKRKLHFENDFIAKIPKIEPMPILEEYDSLIDLEVSRVDDAMNIGLVEMWQKNLGLSADDKNSLLNNGKLNSNHMEAVNILLRAQVDNSISGLQLTERVPLFDDVEERWQYKMPMEPAKSPSCQIHHTHKDHWVCSIQHQGKVYLLDSLGNDRPVDRIIPDGLKIQLSTIYGRGLKSIDILVPSVAKQTNSIDCGLFAIAFATSYCLNKKLCHDVIFNTSNMREHLFQCLNDGIMTEFRKTGKTIGNRRQKNSKTINIENYCICNMPACLDNMVQCDTCFCWFHKYCVNAPSDISRTDKQFICFTCEL